MLRSSLLALFMMLIVGTAQAVPELPSLLVPEVGGRVVDVIAGDTVVLDDGMDVRLVGLQAPKLPLGRTGFVALPLADEARAELAALVLDRDVRLAHGDRRQDRHGRRLTHRVRADGLWIQGAMLAAGMARVYSFPGNRTAVTEMLMFERIAQTARRGICADPFYAVRAPEDAGRLIDTFQVIEGRSSMRPRSTGGSTLISAKTGAMISPSPSPRRTIARSPTPDWPQRNGTAGTSAPVAGSAAIAAR